MLRLRETARAALQQGGRRVVESSEVLATSVGQSMVKPHAAQLKTFRGDYKFYPQWKELFDVAVHLNDRLHSIEKFNYVACT